MTSSKLKAKLKGWQLAEAITRAALKRGEPVLLEGPPGCGKTSLPEQLARAEGWKFYILTTSLCEPADILGLPVRDDGADRASFAPIGVMADVLAEDGAAVLVLDDIGHARPDVQSALWPVVFERRVGGRPLPPGVRVVLTANRATDGAGARALLSPLRSRIPAIVTILPDRAAVLRYLRERYSDELAAPWVAAWLLASEQLAEETWSKAAPRSWELACRWLSVAQAEVPPQDDPVAHADFILEPLRATFAGLLDLDSWLIDIGRAWAISHLVKAAASGGALVAPKDCRKHVYAVPAARVLQARGKATPDALRALSDLCGGISASELAESVGVKLAEDGGTDES